MSRGEAIDHAWRNSLETPDLLTTRPRRLDPAVRQLLTEARQRTRFIAAPALWLDANAPTSTAFAQAYGRALAIELRTCVPGGCDAGPVPTYLLQEERRTSPLPADLADAEPIDRNTTRMVAVAVAAGAAVVTAACAVVTAVCAVTAALGGASGTNPPPPKPPNRP